MTKNVLCFGDSNTWGAAPDGARYGHDVRWPRRAQTILGDGYYLIEEGFCGRTCLIDDPVEGGHKSGGMYLPACLMSHTPLDLVVIMLGVNDTKSRFSLNAHTIAQSAGELVKLCKIYAPEAKVLLVSPILVGENLMETGMAPIFGFEAIEKSKGFAIAYKHIADMHGAEFIDAAQYADPAIEDAIHMSKENQLALADALAAKIKEILG